MKKLIYALLLLAATQVNAQKSVLLKMKYAPNHRYLAAMQINLDFKAALSGDDDMVAKLKSQGIAQPLAVSMAMTMNGVTQTGAPNAKNNFPFTLDYKLSHITGSLNGNAMPIPPNKNGDVKIYGHASADGKIMPDSARTREMKDTSQQKMLRMMHSLQQLIKFPPKPLHVGDTFTLDMPLNLPIAGSNVTTDSKVTYKLLKIADGNAYFDAVQGLDATVPIKGTNLKLAGTGTGALVYNLKNNFPAEYSSKMDIKFNGKAGKLQIDGTAIMTASVKYTIE
jgi:hypothetical protein